MMFKLKVVQAFHGDCLIIEYRALGESWHMLIDGGPGRTYEEHLKSELIAIQEAGGKLDLIVLSHVDDDHINGLLDLFKDLVQQRRREQKPETITAAGLWHNSFAKTLGSSTERSLTRQMDQSPLPRGKMPTADLQERSIRQGSDLTANARGLLIPINREFRDTPDGLICVENADKPFTFENLSVQIVGPTRAALQKLRTDWEKWLAAQKKAAEAKADVEVTARALDKSVPNLSSIMLLIEAEGKSVLLTGDGRGDHLLEGLQQAGVLKEDGTFHVDVFKLPHHGSARNITAELFEQITANTYLICADGKHDNPDYQTLEWLVEAAVKQERSFQLIATNDTDGLQRLVAAYPPASNGYNLALLEAGQNGLTIDLSN